MRIRLLSTVLLAAGCASCASTDFGMSILESRDIISIHAIEGEKDKFRIDVINVGDWHWNADKPEDRAMVIPYFLGEQCREQKLLSETKVPMGYFSLPRKAKFKYSMTVECIN